MSEKPVTIRLLDPPLHEFLPHEPEEIKRLAKDLNKSLNSVEQSILNVQEVY